MQRVLAAGAVAMALLAATPAAAMGICVEGAYPPFSEVKPDGSIVGFDIDIANELCGRIGETCELVQVRWERMIPALLDGRCDAIVASMSDTADRRKLIDFSARYYREPVRFVGRADAGLTDAPDVLASKVVGVQRGTINQAFMSAHYPATPSGSTATRSTCCSTSSSAGSTRCSARPCNSTLASSGRRPGRGSPSSAATISIRRSRARARRSACARRTRRCATGSPRRSRAIRADGTYAAISKRYFDVDIYGE